MFDVLTFLRDYSVEHWTEGKNTQRGWVNINCPLCGDPSNHGGFNIEGGYYHCWRCGGSSVPWVVSHLLSIGYSKAVSLVQAYSGEVPKHVEVERARATMVSVPGGEIEEGDRYHRYLESRGFGMDHVRKYDARGTGKFGELAHRIVFPVYMNGRVVAWQARSIFDVEVRYISSPLEESVVATKETLYNLDNCPKRRVMVTEGPLDVWRLGDQSCALMGVSYTRQQMRLLVERFDEVYLVFDFGDDAQRMAEELGILLSGAGVVVETVELENGDAADMADDEVEQLRKELEL